jgi:hypothetical protein
MPGVKRKLERLAFVVGGRGGRYRSRENARPPTGIIFDDAPINPPEPSPEAQGGRSQ